MARSLSKSEAGWITNLKLVLLLVLYAVNLTLSFRFNLPSQDEVEDVGTLPEDYYQTRTLRSFPESFSFQAGNMGSNHEGLHPIGSDKEVYRFTRKLLTNIAKRTAYAHSKEEIQDHDQHEEGMGMDIMRKRNGGEGVEEYQSGGCKAIKFWADLGQHIYPRYLKTYNCTTNTCSQGLSPCRPKSYTLKVLKTIDLENGVSGEECDTHLPIELRCKWKLEDYNITSYCECVPDMILFG